MSVVRKHYQSQHRFDRSPISQVELNIECRDEITPILAGLQALYTNYKLRLKTVQLVAADLNEDSRRDVGRPVMDNSFVVETNIHYPTESSLIFDGVAQACSTLC